MYKHVVQTNIILMSRAQDCLLYHLNLSLSLFFVSSHPSTLPLPPTRTTRHPTSLSLLLRVRPAPQSRGACLPYPTAHAHLLPSLVCFCVSGHTWCIPPLAPSFPASAFPLRRICVLAPSFLRASVAHLLTWHFDILLPFVDTT